MKLLLKTNDMVTLSYAEALLRDAGIEHQSLDHNMSILDGSIGILPRRLLVAQEREAEARRLLEDAGLGAETEVPKKSS
nr:DUF2007 domain-containing protein [uncultured Cohaesibacter sp.]